MYKNGKGMLEIIIYVIKTKFLKLSYLHNVRNKKTRHLK